MEEKSQISYTLFCNACLCVSQRLNLITDVKVKQFYLQALNEIPQCNMTDVSPLLCWDCEALLCRALQFKEKMKNSYEFLLTYSCQNIDEQLISKKPRLQVKTNESIDIIPESTSLTDEIKDCESERLVKDEIKTDWELKGRLNYVRRAHAGKDANTYVLNSCALGVHTMGFLLHCMIRHDSVDVCTSPELSESRPDTQEIYLKDDLKTECERDNDDDFDINSESYQPDVLQIIDKMTTKKKKTKKVVKRKSLKKKKDKKIKVKKETKHLEINTIEISYEDMMLEREGDRMKDSYKRAEYKCDDCIIGFNYSKSYKMHLTTKHSKTIGEYVCPVCKTVHSSLDSFTTHYKRHMKRYECRICQKRTMDLKVMQQHYYCAHKITLKEYTCGDCGKVSKSIDTHRYHRESHKARLQCSECEKTFRHRAGLLNHRLAVHEFKSKFPCTDCDKVFKWRSSLQRHQYEHDKKKAPAPGAYCALCGINFKTVFSYQRHLNSSLKHITKDQLRFICDHCNVKFADKTKLRDHIEEKHLHKTFQCQICQKVSKNRVGLDQHIRNVHKGRPNNKMCHHCGKGFPTKVQMESHIRSHTGERPFICEFCPTTFSHQSNLYKHNRQVHLNVKSKTYPTSKKKSDVPPDVNTSITPPTVSVVLHYSADNGFLTAEL